MVKRSEAHKGSPQALYDFNKRLGQKAPPPVTDPVALYDTLDRESDKGPLRDPQKAILRTWYDTRRDDRDLILKLHTGQGKTLVGLLILQSQLNAGRGPALYLCPNHYLANQTCRQAKQFGINVVQIEDQLPNDFLDSKAILVTVVHVLFNGLSKFRLGAKSQPVGTLLLDDAHACVDIIRDQFVIRIKSDQAANTALRDLFAPDLEGQGVGTYAEMVRGEYDAILPVPYWSWKEKIREVTTILADNRESNAVRFTWPLLKDNLEHCACVLSGSEVEISPTLPPLEMFGSYAKARHRIFMSATVANDAFLLKGFGMSEGVITNPLIYDKETWSGEKMILIPSLIDESLDRTEIVNKYAAPKPGRRFGVVALTPSFPRCADWKALGAIVATSEDIDDRVDDLRTGQRDKAIVFANRYDGIDLPDAACRLLIFDSKPFAESLHERYMERCLEDSEAIAMAVARKIEQGLGRSVRGEKDYCVFWMIGPDLVQHIRTPEARRYLSAQTRQQIEIGLEVAQMGSERPEATPATTALADAAHLCLRRDDQWKNYYVQRMNEMVAGPVDTRTLKQFAKEREAEVQFQNGDIDGAKAILQTLADGTDVPSSMRGWFLQEAARYEYSRSKVDSNTLQVAAHKRNRALLKPREGMEFKKITLVSQKRVENCRKWISAHRSFEQLIVAVDSILSRLRFGVLAEDFEAAFDRLGAALGFVCERPDRDWKEGPDNLWALRDDQYLLVECKSEVELTRAEVHKSETDQMNRSAAWFAKNYGGAVVTRVLIIPTKTVGKTAAFLHEVGIMGDSKLNVLRKNVRAFFKEFANVDLRDIDNTRIQTLFNTHQLNVEDVISKYSEKPRVLRTPGT